jgi:hypothetical protein
MDHATDVRAYAARAMPGMFGCEKVFLVRTVFPRLDMWDDPKIIV